MDVRLPICGMLLEAFLVTPPAAAQEIQSSPADRVASRINYTDPDASAAERGRRFTQAQQLADKDQWAEAVQAAQAALELERKHHAALETNSACSILQYLAVWQQLAGDYSAAAGTIRQLLATCTRLYGPSHWLTSTTRVDLEICQRDAGLTPAERQRLTEANRAEMQAIRLQAAGKYEAALKSAERAAEIRHEVVGLDDLCGSECLNSMGIACLALQRYKEALPHLERSAAIRQRVLGLENPTTLTTLRSLAVACNYSRDSKQAEQLLEKVLAGSRAVYGEGPEAWREAIELATFYISRNNCTQAEPILTDVLKKQTAALGESNFDVGRTRLRLGQLYARTGDPKANQYLQDAAASFRAVGATATADMAMALGTLGALQYSAGKYEEADQHCKQALEIFAKTTGPNELEAIDTLTTLGRVYKAQGNPGQAERCMREAVDRYAQVYGEINPKSARVLTELGAFYQTVNSTKRSEDCLRQALKINRSLLGEAHPDTITTMLALASFDTLAGRVDQAEQQMQDALALAEKHHGPDHEATHAALFMLGNLHFVRGNYDESERMLHALWKSRQAMLPDETCGNTVILQSLVETLIKKEDYARAAELGEEVLKGSATYLTEFNSGWTGPLQSTAIAYCALGRYDEARQHARRAIDITLRLHDAASMAQSEQQQIKTSAQQRVGVNLYLSLPDTCVSTDDAYWVVLLRKGAIHARQVRARRHLGPQQQPLAGELQEVATQLATLSLKVPEPSARDGWLGQIQQLKDRKIGLETQLAASIRDSQTKPSASQVTPERLRAALPEGTVLVDLFIYSHTAFDHSSGQPRLQRATKLSAFVVRRDRPVQRVDLGELKPIEDHVESWRANGRYASDPSNDASAAALRKQIWEPILPYLHGCETVLFSPDGKLARLPLGALPGERPGSFVLEDFAIGVVPVPQLLPDLFETGGAEAQPAAPSMLLMGDIDFDAHPDGARDLPAPEPGGGGELATFARLKSTGPEVQALAEQYRRHFPEAKLLLLERGDATEAAFRREAAACSTLVVATHGFYAPAGIASALAAQSRALDLSGSDGTDEFCETLSGLALAGANRGAAEGGDDGILTATEVSSLDLRKLDLAVLSGCETALGAVSDGEGALGLQRAFLKAGTRSTVSSLWTVPDRRTRELMQRFHSNRWDNGMSKLDALREAQLWMMRTGGKEGASDDPNGEVAPKRLAPYFWAAFVLSGDWR